MALFEDILPELRKGRKVKRKSWNVGYYIYLQGGTIYDSLDNLRDFTSSELLADDWELVPEEKKHVRWIGLFSDGDSSTHDKQEHVYRYAELYAKKMEPLKSPALVEVRKIEWESE